MKLEKGQQVFGTENHKQHMIDLEDYFSRKLDPPHVIWLKENMYRFKPVKDVIKQSLLDKYKIGGNMLALRVDGRSP